MASPKPSTRIGEAERAAAQRALHDHLNAGRLQVAEYAERSAVAANAVTASEIAALFTDLPAPRPKLPGGRGRAPLLAAAAAAAVVVVVGLLAIGRGGQDAPASSPAALATPTAAAPNLSAVPSRSAPATASATSGASRAASAAGLPGGVTERRTTGEDAITLRPGYGVDLDDDVSPNWSVSQGCCRRDVRWDGNGSTLYITKDYAVMTGPVDYATCSRETGYTDEPLERGSLQAGETICVRTNDSRYAVVTIVGASDQAVQFRATVWDPPISS